MPAHRTVPVQLTYVVVVGVFRFVAIRVDIIVSTRSGFLDYSGPRPRCAVRPFSRARLVTLSTRLDSSRRGGGEGDDRVERESLVKNIEA